MTTECALLKDPPALDDLAPLSYPDLLARFAIGVERFDRRIFQLRGDQANRTFPPDQGVGRWPVRALVSHLADAEMLFALRIRRALAVDGPVEARLDHQALVDSGLYGDFSGSDGPPIAGAVAVIHTIRKWSLDWLRPLTPEQLQRRSLHPESGERTVRRLIELNTWHLEHHAAYLNRKVELLLGPMPEEDCGPGCRCHAGA